MDASSLELSCVVLDVDRTLIRSVRSKSSSNPYPEHDTDAYFSFILHADADASTKRSQSVSSRSYNTSKPKSSPPLAKTSTVPTPSRPPPPKSEEHYHIYIRPGLKKLMHYLRYLRRDTCVQLAIASMASRDYVEAILLGLKRHCTERKFPHFDVVLTRESWDENLSPSSTPTYPMSVLLERHRRGLARKICLKFKSIEKIAEVLSLEPQCAMQNILVVDDDMGYYDHEDRVSGQIYQIPAWNGPVTAAVSQGDKELELLGAMIQSIVKVGSLKKYLFSRVGSVFKHEYGSKHKNQVKLRKEMMNVLINDIGMEIDEHTAISSVWLFDNISRFCHKDEDDSVDEYLEILFGCIIVYQMYIYDVYPSAHFYRLSFTQNEFWEQVMDVFFEYYVRLLFHIKDARIKNSSTTSTTSTSTTTTAVPVGTSHNHKKKSITLSNSAHNHTIQRASQFMSKLIAKTNAASSSLSHAKQPQYEESMSMSNLLMDEDDAVDDKEVSGGGVSGKTTSSSHSQQMQAMRRASIKASSSSSCSSSSSSASSSSSSKKKKKSVQLHINQNMHKPPIQVAQSEPDPVLKSGVEAQEEVILSGDELHAADRAEIIILTQQTYQTIQDNLKTLVKGICKSIFSKNLSPVCFIGHNLLSASRSNPVPQCIHKYQRLLKKVYRDRSKLEV